MSFNHTKYNMMSSMFCITLVSFHCLATYLFVSPVCYHTKRTQRHLKHNLLVFVPVHKTIYKKTTPFVRFLVWFAFVYISVWRSLQTHSKPSQMDFVLLLFASSVCISAVRCCIAFTLVLSYFFFRFLLGTFQFYYLVWAQGVQWDFLGNSINAKYKWSITPSTAPN